MDNQFLSAVILLTLVADPFGNMPLVNAMLAEMEEQYFNEVEPFESYSKRLRLKLYKDLDGFCERFQKGYEVISSEIKDS